jgi:hypothetical protein
MFENEMTEERLKIKRLKEPEKTPLREPIPKQLPLLKDFLLAA